MPKLCAKAGLDIKYIRYEWAAVPQSERMRQSHGQAVFFDTLQKSTCLMVPETRDCKVDVGEEKGRSLERMFGVRWRSIWRWPYRMIGI